MSDAAVRTVDLVKRYPGAESPALDGVSAEIARGEFFCIMGPSGSGKSTFLNLVGALDHPTGGEVFLHGRPLSAERDLDSVRSREVGFIFQLHNLIPILTSVENVEIPMIAAGVPRGERRRRAESLLDAMGLAKRLGHAAVKLSGGERQRVSIARALANEPRLLLADEPTGDVDSRTGGQILDCLLDARKRAGSTLVVVTHNPDVARAADRTVHMRDGRLA